MDQGLGARNGGSASGAGWWRAGFPLQPTGARWLDLTGLRLESSRPRIDPPDQ